MDNTQTRITISSLLDDFITDTLSILAWIKPRGTGSFKPIITSEFADNIVRFQFGIGAGGNNPNQVCFAYFDGSWKILADPTFVTLNQLEMYTVTLTNGNEVELWRGKVMVASATLANTMPADNGNDFFLGHRHDSTASYDGGLDNILIKSDKMSDDFIESYYNNTKFPDTFWKFLGENPV